MAGLPRKAYQTFVNKCTLETASMILVKGQGASMIHDLIFYGNRFSIQEILVLCKIRGLRLAVKSCHKNANAQSFHS